jgi:hypothetical protein
MALAGSEVGEETYYGEDAGHGGLGSKNSSFGYQAGYSLANGSYYNSFMGYKAGHDSTTGYANNFMGSEAGYYTEGDFNNFMGNVAGRSNTTGDYNTFLGHAAGVTIGDKGNTIENNNTLIGSWTNIDYTKTAGTINNATAIGYRAFVATANSLVLGSINGVNGATSSVNVGIGTAAPVRQLHIVGEQAVFRMDRSVDTAAFMLVRTDVSGNPLKTFVVGTNATGSNTGEFVINDLGTAIGGPGNRRMTISNSGSVNFPGAVTAASFTPVSSIVHKTNVKTYENALETVKKLRGVSFDWKESGKPSVGLIAEEVDKVIPEVVAHNDKGATGVNYDSLVGVLVEAVKQQEARHQSELKEQQNHIQKQDAFIQEQQRINADLSKKIADLERMLILSNSVSKAD